MVLNEISPLNFRPLDEAEKRLLSMMLALSFRNSHKLAQQVEGLLIRQRDENLFDLRQIGLNDRASGATFGVPVQGVYKDSDGMDVFVWLYVDKNDSLVELELWKPDGSSIQIPYTQAEIQIKPIVVGNSSARHP